MPELRTPILVGAAQFTQKVEPQDSLTGIGLIERASRLALADTGVSAETMAQALDTLLVVGFTVDAPDVPFGSDAKATNPPRSLARALGLQGRREIYTSMGGNTPQMVVNKLAEEIARGASDAALLTGAEFLRSFMAGLGAGLDMSRWSDDQGAPSEVWGDPRPGTRDFETAHGLNYPVNTYPLFENAIRAARGRTVKAHLEAMGRLFSPFTRVAAANPYAWFPTERSAEELATVSDVNRWIGFPYPKYMNAIIQVDQSAALVMTSVEKARALGIPEDRWIYLHGCADVTDHFFVMDRPRLDVSPAIRGMGQRAFGMAGWTPADVDYIDLYSCFPSAVQVACAELGIAEDDPRGLTVTGGLPYFGGPGNNYVMHSIATMVERLRARKGSKALVTANGWYLTKHSIGLYTTEPYEGTWIREDPKVLQSEIDALPKADLVMEPEGEGVIETYTVVHARKGPRMGIVVGRLSDGRRFLANTPQDEAVLLDLIHRDSMGRPGRVTSSLNGMQNLFEPS